MNMHMSEDDIRTKVIYEWLKDCGISKHQLAIERTINLRLGKGIKKLNSRTDVLVRNDQGRNLLIVEVKKLGHHFSKDDEHQAISYARAVDGNIAPFTILTNGRESVIYDTVSKEQINSSSIPSDHPHVKSGFMPSSDGIRARMEALEFLISFSEDNLLTFCKGQVDFRMRLLKGKDLFSGKKYIPELYVERSEPITDLRKKLFDYKDQAGNLVLIIGPPQHGKTCFMCHTAEQFLSEGYPTLFYPAVGLNSGLISSMHEDFEWCFGEYRESTQWIRRLNSIGERLKKRIFVFIDGWNEMAEKALQINYECQRLELNHIVVVLSTTSPSLKRLLSDEAGNPTYVAERVGLTEVQIEKLLTDRLRDTEKLKIVQIGKFDHNESPKAKQVYGMNYNVTIQTHDLLLSDPFYLRLACELFTGGKVPDSITRTELISKSLVLKAKRRNINELVLHDSLVDLSEVFYKNDRPTSILHFPKPFRDEENLIPWLESAILILLKTEGPPHLDFYYSHDLDFSVAVLYKNWKKLFAETDEMKILEEMNSSVKTEVGQSAIRWFLSAPENCGLIQGLFNSLKFNNPGKSEIIKILFECIDKQVVVHRKIGFQWLESHLDKLVDLEMSGGIHGRELSGLIFALLMSLDRDKNQESYVFWMRLLIKHDDIIDELGIQESYVYRFYGGEDEDIRGYDGCDDETSLDTSLMRDLIFDKDIIIAKRAAYIYAYACQVSFLKDYLHIRKKLHDLNHDYYAVLCEACDRIAYDLGEQYYGYSMCKGWLEHRKDETNDDAAATEYHKMKGLLYPIISHYAKEKFSTSLNGMLKDLKKIGGIVDDSESQRISYEDFNQLKFDF